MASRSRSGTPNSAAAAIAISRALARPPAHEVRDEIEFLFFGRIQRIEHRGLVKEAVLDEPLGQAAK